MRIVAINGSYRKGRTNDTLIERAIAGVRSVDPEAEVEKITLIDRKIEYCRNCMVCRDDDPVRPVADCVIDDDMKEIYPLLERADGYIIATPVNMANVTALLKTFLERVCWVLAKPGRRPRLFPDRLQFRDIPRDHPRPGFHSASLLPSRKARSA